jgi:hypothetical protein
MQVVAKRSRDMERSSSSAYVVAKAGFQLAPALRYGLAEMTNWATHPNITALRT